MILKYFKHGKGTSAGVMNYMLGKQNERAFAKVLKGNRKLTSLLIDTSPFEYKYTSGVLSFEKLATEISDEIKTEIMQSFEEATFAGLEHDSYDILWIEHSDKNGRLELNFVIPRVELKTNKSLTPFFHKKDKKRMNAWKILMNKKYSFSDPNDIRKQRDFNDFDSYKIDEVKVLINAKLLKQLQLGKLKNRRYVEHELEQIVIDGVNVEIDNVRKSSITIRHPSFKSRNNKVRLTGEVYKREFKYRASDNDEMQKETEEIEQRRRLLQSRIAERDFEVEMQKAIAFNQRKYALQDSMIQPKQVVQGDDVEEEMSRQSAYSAIARRF